MRRLLLFTLLLALVPMSSARADTWQPEPGATWQWQLQGTLDTTVSADVYDIDGFDNSKAVVGNLHDDGRHVICYISAGSWEKWRPDADAFPSFVIGKRLDGWEGERWLDIRRVAKLKGLMTDRVEMCARKGFDAVEFDNVDGYANDSGFDLSGSDQKTYNRMLADLAHDNGLAAALKNDLGQVKLLEPDFDFAINEECFSYNECNKLAPFTSAGKAVFHVEYEMGTGEFCDQAIDLGFSSMRKRWSLRAWRNPC